jgi:hypothetical protein
MMYQSAIYLNNDVIMRDDKWVDLFQRVFV